MGWETRHRWHQTNWEEVAKNPEFLKLPQPAWLFGHDPEGYVKERLDDVTASVKQGTDFQSTNLPPGYVHEDWNVQMLMDLEGRTMNGGYKVQVD